MTITASIRQGIPVNNARTNSRVGGAFVALVLTLALVVSACSSGSSDAKAEPGTKASGHTIAVPADHPSIQAAVDAAAPGDLILVSPGVYNESVNITTAGVTLRGTDRNTVILDGEFKLENGVRVLGANNVTVQNMTARNYTNNAFFWTGVRGYHGSYLTSYRTGNYGIYAFDSVDGQFDHSFASGSPDAGFYIGQCFPCNAAIVDSIAEYNGLGYSGTNSGGNLVIARSEFRFNRAGIVPNSGSYELCYPERDTTIVGNLVHDNSQPDTPAIDVAKLAMGNGIILPGGYNNLILRNQVWNHERVGIALVPFPEDGPKDDIPTGDELTIPCSEARNLPLADKASLPGTVLWDPVGNRVEGNTVSSSGIADLAFGTLAGSGDPLDNCFTGNTFSTSAPSSIETTMACSSPSGSWTNTLDLVALIASARPDSGDYKVQPVPPAQPNMPDATTAPGQPAVNLPAKIDLDSIPLPAKP
jgi:hypothetical protein